MQDQGFDFSRLTLGTAQFGMPYGIANRTGQPSYESARDIIACAHDGGVNCLDTAACYGVSEAVIGSALHELGLHDKMHIVTKVPAVPAGLDSAEAVEPYLDRALRSSLERLQLACLPLCLFHLAADAQYLDALTAFREKGLIRHVGVSVDTPEEAVAALEQGQTEALQVPFNLLDKRMEGAGVLETAQRRGVVVFARSVYLQGLILMPEDHVIPGLRDILPTRRALAAIAEDAGITLAEMAVRYSLSVPEISSVVIGVDNVEQMRETLELTAKGGLPADILGHIRAVVPDLEERLIRPHCWPANR